MLVLSRRSKEKISFPDVGITLHFIRVQSGTARVGIDAPLHIKIVRDEVDRDAAEAAEATRNEFLRLPRGVRHAIRNELHAISVGLHLYKEQMRLGLQDDGAETLKLIMQSLQVLDESEVLRRPATEQQDEEEPRQTLLVVDHHENERELLASSLRVNGYHVVSLPDGQQALNYLANYPTPAVILINMERLQGDVRTILCDVRGDSETGDSETGDSETGDSETGDSETGHSQEADARERQRVTKVFAIGSTSPEDNGVETGPQGVDRWFAKPLNFELLINAIENDAHPADPRALAPPQRDTDRSPASI